MMRPSPHFRVVACDAPEDVQRTSPFEFDVTSDVCSFVVVGEAFTVEPGVVTIGGEPWRDVLGDAPSGTPLGPAERFRVSF